MTEPKANPITPPARLVIDRARWLRGEGSDSSLLRDRDRKMCCLGFMGLACGYTEADILTQAEPGEMNEEVGKTRWPAWLVVAHETDRGHEYLRSSKVVEVLIEANDSTTITDATREEKIAAIFAQHGIDVEFIGDAPKTPKSIP